MLGSLNLKHIMDSFLLSLHIGPEILNYLSLGHFIQLLRSIVEIIDSFSITLTLSAGNILLCFLSYQIIKKLQLDLGLIYVIRNATNDGIDL